MRSKYVQLMAVIQSDINELRFSKRQNLHEEARVFGNYFRDLIRQYGVDCTYYKLDTRPFDQFKTTIDRNALLKRAYGVEQNPDYTISADMITYVTVDSDIFQLNKIGLQPQLDVQFVFDSNDFACALATKLGQYKEYPIEKTDFVCEVPPPDKIDPEHPYQLDIHRNDVYKCRMLKGQFQAVLSGYDLDTEQTIECFPYEHTSFNTTFPVNSDLYYSLKRTVENDDFLETMLRMTFTVRKVLMKPSPVSEDEDICKYVLHGQLHGSVLFFDLDQLGKYAEQIHPSTGDIVEIDFPDKSNREKYEITECIDKQLTPDGINPLMHKYIWKCKARRYTNSYETLAPADNEADKRIRERQDFDAMVQEEIGKKISMYPNNEDSAYGGMDGIVEKFDHNEPDSSKHQKYEYLEDGTCLDIMRFDCGSRLVTNGYDLIFVTADGDAYIVATCDHEPTVNDAVFESGLRWLKSTASEIVFVNIEGQSTIIARDEKAPEGQLEICLNDLHSKTLDSNKDLNDCYDNFIKFKGSRSLIWATEYNLYAKLESNKHLYKLI